MKYSDKASDNDGKAWGSQETSRKILFLKEHGSLRGPGCVPPVTIAVSVEV